jgi:hypothetical protein
MDNFYNIGPRAQLFTPVVINVCCMIVFDPGKTFQASLMFAGKAYPRVEHMKGTSLG